MTSKKEERANKKNIQRYKIIWEQCLSLIKENVSEKQYSTWFAPIIVESFSEKDKTLLVQIPSHYVYEYLEQYYAGLLKKALTRCFKEPIRLMYRIVTDKEHNLTQDIEAEDSPAIDPIISDKKVNVSPSLLDGATPQNLESHLNPKQTFANYVEGASNRLSRAVGLSVAEHPGKSTFNPFFVYGPSGCGKTHLINAIGIKCKEIYPNKRVLYVSARLFQVQYTDSQRHNQINDFIYFYQSVDVLIIDDVQEWTTPGTLDIFFHIFNHLFRNGKQIVFACDRPPVDLVDIKDRMLTRFCCGIIAELEKPDERLRVDILKAKCRRDGLSLSEEVIEYIAKKSNGSVRDLIGVVNSLMAYSVVYNCNVDRDLVERVMKRTIKVEESAPTAEEIINKVCQYYNVTRQNVISNSRKHDFVVARHVSMYLTKKYTDMSVTRIGHILGNRNHATVLHGCMSVEQRIQIDKTFATELERLESSFMGLKQK